MKKTLDTFESTHGKPKIDKLQKELLAERAKVAALADVQGHVNVVRTQGCHIRFGLIGDTHIGSLYFHKAAFGGLLEFFRDEGVDTAFHTGDAIDGHKVYKGQEFELQDLGLDAQLERLASIDTCGLTIKFITGNHDASFKSLAGVPVGKLIAQANRYWSFLGEEQAIIEFATPNGPYRLQLLHPGGGTAYALSYRPQKITESLGGGSKPNMLAVGHFHKAEFIPSYRNVAVIQTGTMQKQTPFMARQGLAAHVGGWIIDVDVGKTMNLVKAEFAAFYV